MTSVAKSKPIVDQFAQQSQPQVGEHDATADGVLA